MLVKLGYDLDSKEVKSLISYFKNYLIGMQLNDDAHDWKEDMERGHLSTVVVMLLQDFKEKYPNKKEIDLNKDMKKLEEVFWFETIVRAGNTCINYTKKSRRALKSIKIFEDITPLLKFVDITENSAKEALKEQKNTLDFLKTYKG